MPVQYSLSQFRRLSFFAFFRADDWAAIEGQAREVVLSGGESICREGMNEDRCNGVYFVSAGQVMVTRLSPAGRNLIVRILKPGELFFTAALFDGGPAPATMEAMDEARVWLVPRQVLLPIIAHNPAAALAAFEAVAGLIRQAHAVIEGLAFKGNAGRLAGVLLELSQYGPVDRRQFSLETLSSRTSTVPEVVSRLLHQFADERIIELSRDEIGIINRRRLQEIAAQ